MNARTGAERIFHAARLHPAGALREAYLEQICNKHPGLRARIETLLLGLAEAEPESGPPARSSAAQALCSGEQAGDRIGRYTLVQEIGEGGFGTVWMAEQREPVKRRVALKIIKLGMDTRQVIARFEAERQALALMDHPNVAKVLDAGATDTGRPYFVMEHVKGVGIVEYCNTARLDVRARLELFTKVCLAIQHAHQKGIIHRDIKPSNVLVCARDANVPEPIVIDFGIAKATNAKLAEQALCTDQRQVVGTPEYMSPEQADLGASDIDTRSDVYGLGVLLYELLTGTLPFDLKGVLLEHGYAAMMRVICEQSPEQPSARLAKLGAAASRIAKLRSSEPRRLAATLAGDLDWIALKCLEKDRARRYESASDLAVDIQRHLRDEPVTAGPPGAAYRVKKFVRRHRRGVLAAAALVLLLVLGIVGTSLGLAKALRETQRANQALAAAKLSAAAESAAKEDALLAAERAREAEEAARARSAELEQVAQFQESLLADIDVARMGARVRADVLDAKRAALERGASDAAAVSPAVAELDSLLAGVNFTSVALESLQETFFDGALAAIEADFADQPLVKARLLQAMAITLRKLGLLDLAAAPQDEALALRRRDLGDEHADTLRSLAETGFLILLQGGLAEAEPYYRQVLESCRRQLGDEDLDTAVAIHNMGHLLQWQNEYAEAEVHYRQALEIRRRLLGDEHRDTLASLQGLGTLLLGQGRFPEAEACLREALETSRRVLGNDVSDTVHLISNMGTLLLAQGRTAEAVEYYREGLDAAQRVFGDEHAYTLGSQYNWGRVLQEQGRLAEAEACYREVLETRRRLLGDEHPDTLVSMNSVGSLMQMQGRLAEAEPYYRTALEAGRRVRGSEHTDTLGAINNVGSLLMAQGKLDEAEPYFSELVETCRRTLGGEHPYTLVAISNLAALANSRGKTAEAEVHLREVLEVRRRTLGNEHPATLLSMNNHAAALQALGHLDEAEPLFREALEGHRRALGEEHPDTSITRENLANCLRALERARAGGAPRPAEPPSPPEAPIPAGSRDD